MEIYKCTDDLQEVFFSDILAIIGVIFLCSALSWNIIAIVASAAIILMTFVGTFIDWLYLSRRIVLDEVGCTFISGKRKKRFTWQEMNVQYVDELSVLFADCEIAGDGVIISANPISKSTYIGAMTYCKFTHPFTSVFIRFGPSPENIKKAAGKFIYGGFFQNRSDLRNYLESINVCTYTWQ